MNGNKLYLLIFFNFYGFIFVKFNFLIKLERSY